MDESRLKIDIKDLSSIPYLKGLSVLRDDIFIPEISGNKWWKLKYNLQYLQDQKKDFLITFGGAFSNHIYATAAACHQYGIPSVGIIRGEYDADNPTRKFAQEKGMKLHFVSRTAYREKEGSTDIQKILDNYPNHHLVAEGGSNAFATIGLQELANTINATDFDTILVSAGTGKTAHGILSKLDPSKKLWVFSALKHAEMKAEILGDLPKEKENQLRLFPDYHLGGYAKTNYEYISFINSFYQDTKIPIDPIYNGKLVYGYIDLLNKGLLDNSSRYLWIHTGGVQGVAAYNYMARKKMKTILTF